MRKTLTEIAKELKNSKKKVQLIYAFNGVGKTRLSREFKQLITPKTDEETEQIKSNESGIQILYYNAFTEDLFYWDNDLEFDAEPKLKIQTNSFTDWVLQDQGQDQHITTNFQRYTNQHLTPSFSADGTEVTFSLKHGDDKNSGNIKISKGEESLFIWSIFYTLIDQVISVLTDVEPDYPETGPFDQLRYIFIDDPVSSLDENHLIELAVHLAQLIRSNQSTVKFIITTHNPLFYNVLYNELNNAKKYILAKHDAGTYELKEQKNDSPFSYHLYLKSELEKAIQTGQVQKYHFNFLRNILEKTATFLGHEKWGDLLPKLDDEKPNPYEARILNIFSHSQHAGEEVAKLTDDDKRVLVYLVKKMNEMYRFKSSAT